MPRTANFTVLWWEEEMFNFDETFFSNFIFTIINLLFLYWILKKLLFKPVTKFMESRSERVKEAIESAEANKEEIEKLKLEYMERLKSADGEGKKIIEEHRERANYEYNMALSTAKKDAQKLVDEARKEIESEKTRAINDIKKEVSDLVISATEKVIEKNIDSETNRKLISEFIDDTVA
ncbi:MAG: F0F1 ATP synthase subunit B [Clostridia bacterium]|nr:F0F1 ATP synthase subunit B [Clostridia bacterium]